MKLRSALTSAPAVAGLAFLALVIGAVFGVRATMNDGDGTEVAGNVIERPEAAASEEATERVVDEPLIVRPRPERPRRTEQPPPPAQTAQTDPAADEVVEGPVGLVREPEPAPEQDTTQPRERDRTEPRRQPEPEPEAEPTPEPRPEPKPTTQPEDTSRYALRPGEGLSRDVAEAMDTGNSGKWEWQIRSIAGHDSQSAELRRSRKAMARLEVGFNEEAKTSKESVRDFRCDAVLSAGSRRLVTDRDHFFEIQMWTTKDYALQDLVSSVFVRETLDLAPGEQHTLQGNMVPDRDAAEGLHYTCTVEYRER